MSSRFELGECDKHHKDLQAQAKQLCSEIEILIVSLGSTRATALALTKLEECHMWLEKAIRTNNRMGWKGD